MFVCVCMCVYMNMYVCISECVCVPFNVNMPTCMDESKVHTSMQQLGSQEWLMKRPIVPIEEIDGEGEER